MPIEKINLPPEARVVKQEDGTEKTVITEPWEVRATGKEINELRGAFRDAAPQMLHQGMKDWEAHGGSLKVTKANGEVDEIRADKEQEYREKIPGFCQSRVRPGITVSGFGGMRRRGTTRYRAVYSKGTVTVLEER